MDRLRNGGAGPIAFQGEGHAGILLRVNEPNTGFDRMKGYYVGLNRKKLYLMKINYKDIPLKEYDLTKLDCQMKPGEWNMIRVALEGPRIRVWVNRMHPSSDPENGLRIDYTDADKPILSGAIGTRTTDIAAWYDNIVVLPIDQLPK